jgi:hypothetical protein
MSNRFKYDTTTEAVMKLREIGFTENYSISEGYISNGTEKFDVDDVRILFTSRYEGDSDPADETTVYGLETKHGTKGILVTADGIYADRNAGELLQKLHRNKLKRYSSMLNT